MNQKYETGSGLNLNGPGQNAVKNIANKLAEALSESVTAKSEEIGPDVLGLGLDKFVRETPGGKIVMNKLTWYTLLPYLAAGIILGWVLHGVVKR